MQPDEERVVAAELRRLAGVVQEGGDGVAHHARLQLLQQALVDGGLPVLGRHDQRLGGGDTQTRDMSERRLKLKRPCLGAMCYALRPFARLASRLGDSRFRENAAPTTKSASKTEWVARRFLDFKLNRFLQDLAGHRRRK